MPQPTTRYWKTVRETAEHFGVAERTVQHWIATGELEAERLDPKRAASDWIITLTAIAKFEKQRARSEKDGA